MGEITQESHFEMLEKLPDGNFKIKYPKVKSKSGVTFDEHLAETMSEVISVDRDGLLMGTQEVICTVNRKPKSIITLAIMQSSIKQSIGISDGVNNTATFTIAGTGYVNRDGNQAIVSAEGNTHKTNGNLNNFQKGKFNIDWTKNGNGSPGTIRVMCLVQYHGED